MTTFIKNYKNAVASYPILDNLLEDPSRSKKDGRYWISVFSDLSNEGISSNDVIVLFDIVTGNSLCIETKLEEEYADTHVYCKFTRYFEGQGLLVLQFSHELFVYQLNQETLKIEESLNTRGCQSYPRLDTFSDAVIASLGINYMSLLAKDKKTAFLVKFDFIEKNLDFISLKSFYFPNDVKLLDLFVGEKKWLKKYPAVVLKVRLNKDFIVCLIFIEEFISKKTTISENENYFLSFHTAVINERFLELSSIVFEMDSESLLKMYFYDKKPGKIGWNKIVEIKIPIPFDY